MKTLTEKMIVHKLIEDDPGDRERYGVDSIEIEGHLFEFQAICDLWEPEIKALVKEQSRNKKYKVNYRCGKTGHWTKKSFSPMNERY